MAVQINEVERQKLSWYRTEKVEAEKVVKLEFTYHLRLENIPLSYILQRKLPSLR